MRMGHLQFASGVRACRSLKLSAKLRFEIADNGLKVAPYQHRCIFDLNLRFVKLSAAGCWRELTARSTQR